VENNLNPSEVVVGFWSKWRYRPGSAEPDSRTVVAECWKFIREALGGEPGAIYLLKTPGAGADDDHSRRLEESAWRAAMADLESENRQCGTEFQFRYFTAPLTTNTAWEVGWWSFEWWTKGSILAQPAMDFIEARFRPPQQLAELDAINPEIRPAIEDAPRHFGNLVRATARHQGLTVGGYRTHEWKQEKGLLERRGGLAAKDLIEAAFRCYASGALAGYKPLQELLNRYPALRLRSEILAVHRNCWNALRRGKRLGGEPWESTMQLVLGALLEGCTVEQEPFGWMLEEGNPKPDSVVAEQMRRGLHLIERLRQSWFEAAPRLG
jgi:hypothetical protein